MAENPPTDHVPTPGADKTPLGAAPLLGIDVASIFEAMRGGISGATRWCTQNPTPAALWAGILATLYYFFWVYHPFVNGQQSTVTWAWLAWNPDGDQIYDRIVPFVGLGLLWFHRDRLRRAPVETSNQGLVWLFFGIAFFIVGSRSLQPRLTLLSVPFLIYGATMFVWGRKVARVILFPCAFQIFMVPAGAFTQVTFRLQFIVTALVGSLAHLFGIGIQAVGTTLAATDGSFNFEIAEGCSGIRSLVAMMMLTAIYVHLTQTRLWKKLAIFSASILFALIGNTGRILSIVLIAKYYDEKFAAGAYHESSGWISFPFALGAMLVFDWFLDRFADTLNSPPSSEDGTNGSEPHPVDPKAPPPSPESKRPKYDY